MYIYSFFWFELCQSVIENSTAAALVDIVFDVSFLSFQIDHASRYTGLDEPIQRSEARKALEWKERAILTHKSQKNYERTSTSR